MSAFVGGVLNPMLAIGWLWNLYVVALHVALLVGATALLAWSCGGTAAATRAALWDIAPVALLGMTLLCHQPVGWGAWVIPRFAADPLVALGGLDIAAQTALPSTRETLGLGWLLAARVGWYAGAMVMGTRLLWSWRCVASVARRSVPVREPAFVELLAASRVRMAIRRPVALRSTHEVASPFVTGLWRPTIVVPHDALGWPEDVRRCVLLHELAHVKRHDCAAQLLAQTMRALYWFHPAAWIAASRQRASRELACDAMVVASGERRSTYAECLLQLSSLARPGHVAVAGVMSAGLVRPSSTDRRVRELLERARLMPRHPRFSRAFTTLSMTVVVAVLGSMRLAPTPAVLWRALDSPDWSVRRYAAYVLVHRRDPALVARVRARIAADPNPRVARRL